MYFFLLPTVPRRLLLSFSYFAVFCCQVYPLPGCFLPDRVSHSSAENFPGGKSADFLPVFCPLDYFARKKCHFPAQKGILRLSEREKCPFSACFLLCGNSGRVFGCFSAQTVGKSFPDATSTNWGHPLWTPTGSQLTKITIWFVRIADIFYFCARIPERGKRKVYSLTKT